MQDTQFGKDLNTWVAELNATQDKLIAADCNEANENLSGVQARFSCCAKPCLPCTRDLKTARPALMSHLSDADHSHVMQQHSVAAMLASVHLAALLLCRPAVQPAAGTDQ